MVTFVETRVLPVDPHHPSRTALTLAAALLRSGWPVAFPTETVYGLGADALNPVAVRAIFRAKGRPADDPLIVHVADPDHVQALAQEIPPLARRLIERFWPGPLTLVLRRSPDVPPEVSGGLRTIAVRMPAHPVALALIRDAGMPLAAPSANLSGRPSPTTAARVLQDLNTRIPLILDAGPTAIGSESTVLDLAGPAPVLLRPGGITLEALEPIVGRTLPSPGATRAKRSPGTRYRHYRPRAPVTITPQGDPLENLVDAYRAQGLSVGVICRRAASPLERAGVRLQRLPESIAEYAHGLFPAMRALDEAGVDVILVESVEERGLGVAVMDRLRRAATQPAGDAPRGKDVMA